MNPLDQSAMVGGAGGKTRLHGDLLRLTFPAFQLVDKFDQVVFAEETGVSNI